MAKEIDEHRENIREQVLAAITRLEELIHSLPDTKPKDWAEQCLIECSAHCKLAVDAI